MGLEEQLNKVQAANETFKKNSKNSADPEAVRKLAKAEHDAKKYRAEVADLKLDIT